MTLLLLPALVLTSTLSREERLGRDLAHAQRRADLALSALTTCQVERDARDMAPEHARPVVVAAGHAVLWAAVGGAAGAAGGYGLATLTERSPGVVAGGAVGGAFLGAVIAGLLADD